jgi:hypothetical protein
LSGKRAADGDRHRDDQSQHQDQPGLPNEDLQKDDDTQQLERVVEGAQHRAERDVERVTRPQQDCGRRQQRRRQRPVEHVRHELPRRNQQRADHPGRSADENLPTALTSETETDAC